MPRVRRPRRQAPALELLEATLPELRRGLTESAARTVAYELFEKLGYGAVAVTDTHEVLAFVGAGADHHGAGDTPMRPVYEAITRGGPLLAPLGIRTECNHPACPLGAVAVVPLQLTDGPAGAIVAYATTGSPLDETAVETLNSLGTQLSAQLQLSELHTATTTALQAQMEPHFVFNALNTIAAFIRTEPERARKLVPPLMQKPISQKYYYAILQAFPDYLLCFIFFSIGIFTVFIPRHCGLMDRPDVQ